MVSWAWRRGGSAEGFGAFGEDGEVGAVGVDAAVFASGGFLDQIVGGEGVEHFLDGMEGEACGGDCGGCGGDRVGLKMGEETQGGASGAAEVADAGLVFAEEGEEAAGGLYGAFGDLFDAFEEENEPFLPVAFFADGLQELVVAGTVLFEIQGEVEQWVPEHAFGVEQEGDEKAAEAAVAIQEGVDGFELHMGERGLDKNGGGDRLVVEEFFQCAEAFQQGIRRRGHMGGIAGSGAADPVLAAAELAGFLVRAATFAQEHSVDFADEAQRYG